MSGIGEDMSDNYKKGHVRNNPQQRLNQTSTTTAWCTYHACCLPDVDFVDFGPDA